MGANPEIRKILKFQRNMGSIKEYNEKNLQKAKLEVYDWTSNSLHSIKQNKEILNKSFSLETLVQIPRRHSKSLVFYIFQKKLIQIA